jgi:uncharacterized OsmC-like protein
LEVLVRYDSGTRFTATCGEYTVATGKGDDGDESRDGMWPAQLFAASIGMCIGGYVVSYCQHHGIPYEGMVIELDRETARAPSRTTTLRALIRLPVPVSEKDAKAILQVADRCHITNSIVQGMTVDVSLASEAVN